MLAKSDKGRAKPMSPTFTCRVSVRDRTEAATVGRSSPACDSTHSLHPGQRTSIGVWKKAFLSQTFAVERRTAANEPAMRRLDIPVQDVLLMKIVKGSSDVIPDS